MIAVSFVKSGLMPSRPTCPPAKVASVTKNLDFAADKDRPVSLIHCRSCLVLDSMILKLSPAIPPSSTNSSIRILVKSPSALAVIPANVDSAPVRPNGMRR